MSLPIFIISLKSAKARRDFQKAQAKRYDLDITFIDAIEASALAEPLYKGVTNHWLRPMAFKESACYLSHKKAWQIVAKATSPVLVIEDDTVFSKDIKQALAYLETRDDPWDWIYDLEWVNRKHVVSKKTAWQHPTMDLCARKLLMNKNGAGAYLLHPKGAKLLLQHAPLITLVESHLWNPSYLKAYQIESALTSQLLFLDPNKNLAATHPSSIPQAPNHHQIPSRARWLCKTIRLGLELHKAWIGLMGMLWGEKRYLRINKDHFCLDNHE